jgi:hypothetical protein
VNDLTDPTTLVVAGVSLVVAISALSVAMATYFRNRKSEQIRVAREIMEKVDLDYRKAFEFDPSETWPSTGEDKEKRKFVYDYLVLLGYMVANLRYLSYLVKQGEIYNKTVLRFYRRKVIGILDYLDQEYTWAEKSSQHNLMAKWPGYHAAIPILKKIWEEKISSDDLSYP